MVWLTTGIGGFLAAGVVLVMAIASYRTDKPLPHFPAGTTIDAGEWRVLPLSVRIDTTTPDGRKVRDGQKALVVEMDLTNRTAASSNSFGRLLTLDPSVGKDQPTYMLLRDHELLWELHPDMTERVAAVWTLPQDAAVPAVLKFAVRTSDYKRRDNLWGHSGWYNPHMLGIVDIPLQAAGPT
ncbi:hypothetical protein [Inquilinus limosus]|uniref:DUF4352 domain-containing protein n=1 Tax=Inquilinus limosus TaxID=171674 RepID=A0A211ZA66_9PROT|nr:hypothetical protein [Inquilinus limosus]OWJ62034.1 hypothetical protein BWR60_30550 [Inquilinus limosus]